MILQRKIGIKSNGSELAQVKKEKYKCNTQLKYNASLWNASWHMQYEKWENK